MGYFGCVYIQQSSLRTKKGEFLISKICCRHQNFREEKIAGWELTANKYIRFGYWYLLAGNLQMRLVNSILRCNAVSNSTSGKLNGLLFSGTANIQEKKEETVWLSK